MNNCYVYAYLDPRKPFFLEYNNIIIHNEPFYIGEGKNLRKYDHLLEEKPSHKTNKIKEILNSGFIPEIVTFVENVTKAEAIKIETELINTIGVRTNIEGVKYGPLTNLRLYGKNGLISNETKEKMSQVKIGKVFSETHRKNLSIAKKGKPSKFKGLKRGPLSAETKLKLSNIGLGKKRSLETRKNISIAQSGKILSIEHKNNLSKALKGRKSAMTKKWIICHESGKTEIIENLTTWCLNANIIKNSLRNTLLSDKYFKGYKLVQFA